MGALAGRPLLLISLHRDVVTPEDQGAELLYRVAGPPKTLIRQNEPITHYRSYERNLDLVGPLLVDFFRSALVTSRLTVSREGMAGLVVEHVG